MDQDVKRVFNFSAGPAVLPVPALKQAQKDLLALPGVGASVMEISHRSKTFSEILEKAKANVKTLLRVPDNYRILFLQGGASLQFSMVAMNLLRGSGKPADYIITGSWGGKAAKEAKKEGTVNIAWDGKNENYVRVPDRDELKLSPDAAYVHFTSNETIQGVQFPAEPSVGDIPLVCDASSDILSRPIPVERYGIIYAGAQKNIGPSGVALVIIREDLLERSSETLPSLLNYKLMAEENSLYNTPPTFAIYMIMLVTNWLLDTFKTLERVAENNTKKASLLYKVIDESNGFYKGHAQPKWRSNMNVTWRLPSEDLEKEFVREATSVGLTELKGHRSVGGCRASIYNAMPLEGVETLCAFMKDFQQKHG
ncbi:MAG TPA: 3-phosphoserine/phosphohydroxythreonine transaminase [Candidatus Hydrogenedentes bacterium]|nr:3-phosphoserine/phosphohydroxythreonine transaminase [Candidatus Hydrogenedentota bacterium]HOL75785.1 3-phosphoserine/phosphohydroxythreonine transaminase [Candidatus Hydrogenedentota bacterium]HPO84221.1 3-phosphoserine/phosphohydroxythreonine transaminase [Candidatus Hydrogenedentota bacterium]